ncbi:hypothetical protein HNO88_003685 [Novosphingobium chloroacetimidivorans]|uniref:Uncharacterized protein n=1 Tax=Novosphingobium chloroacetimidivorans TaxID=1428314 RepID=A0A7W7KCM0_9SPHN|nr:hypothetical protein [Novosphingobium chloroacetimidivorans]MBB4860342.1 hypothetical protein [Novosphingobium chloroacetimidivorans]
MHLARKAGVVGMNVEPHRPVAIARGSAAQHEGEPVLALAQRQQPARAALELHVGDEAGIERGKPADVGGRAQRGAEPG